MRLLQRVVSGLLDVLAPVGCSACDGTCAPGQAFCDQCGPVPRLESGLTLHGVPLLVAGHYRPPLSTAIVRFKYSARPELSRPLSGLVLPELRRQGLPASVLLVPVPLHPRRLAMRGYNQAALLAQELAKAAKLPCRPRLLLRSREMERQVGKSREERVENARGAFELRQAGPASVVLVDDVITTGSTVRACAQALAAGGIRVVAIAALARAEQGW